MSKLNPKCAGCGFDVVRNFGIVGAGGAAVVPLCSPACRDAMRRTTRDGGATEPPPSARARKPKRPARTPGEIKRALQPSESRISKTIRDEMSRTSAYSSRLQAGQLRIGKYNVNLCTPGTPDSIFADGVICFVEIKKAGKLPSAEQKRVQSDLRANGAVVFTVDNTDDYLFIKSELKANRGLTNRIAALVSDLQQIVDYKLENYKKGKEKIK